MNKSLFDRTVRLAHAKPELRPHLLPLIQKYAGSSSTMTPMAPDRAGELDMEAEDMEACYHSHDDYEGQGKPGKGNYCNKIYNEYGSGVSSPKSEYNKKYPFGGKNKGRKTCPKGQGHSGPCGKPK